jgi:predicted nucleic-acid-binding Zn-ribbon protein
MKESVDCIKCHAHMEPGWVADKTQGGFAQQKWSAGEPRPSFWTGLKMDKDQIVPVTTFRCPNCGYLESYALTQNQGGDTVSKSTSSQRQVVAVMIGLLALLAAFGAAFLLRAR